jgi:hypothetical protein
LYAIVLFSVPQNVNHRTCTASWVRVAMLDSGEQSKLRSECENVIFLESIREGVEKEVKNARHDSQTRFYIQWKQKVVSIQCSSVGPS